MANDIRTAGLIDGGRADMIAYHLCTEMTALETQATTHHLRRRVEIGGLFLEAQGALFERIAAFLPTCTGFEVG